MRRHVGMEFQQRAADPRQASAAASPGERLWLSGVAESPVEPTPSDRYVVVDERDEGVLVLVVAPWPTLDPRGRLTFAGRRKTVAVSEAELGDVLDRRRRRSGELRRPLRIGDAFLVRGQVTTSPSEWPRVVDVTSFARAEAKMAFHAAVAPKATAQEAKALELDAPRAAPDGPVPGVAHVARPDV
jgi:hypothetical protein